MADDDLRRATQIYRAIELVLRHHGAAALAYEIYSPYGRQGGNAWKSARAEGLVVAAGLAADVPVLPFIVQDLKKHIGESMKASKEKIVEKTCALVDGLAEAMEPVPKSMREHVGDAAGYAYLALLEIDKMRQLTGMGA